MIDQQPRTRLSRLEVALGLFMAAVALDGERLPSTGLANVLTGLVCLWTIYELVALPRVPNRALSRLPMTLLGGWYLWSVVGAATSENPATALWTTALFGVAALASIQMTSDGGPAALARTLGLALGAAVVFALAGAVIGADVAAPPGRLGLLFLEPNQLARAAALVAICSAGELLGSRGENTSGWHIGGENNWVQRIRSPWFAVTAGAGIIVLLTMSRTGASALVAGLVVLTAIHWRQRWLVPAVVVAGLVASVLLLQFESLAPALTRDDSVESTELGSLNGRTVLWPEVLDSVAERPVTGHGLGLDREIVGSYRSTGRLAWDAQHTHNLALQVLLTAGFVGLILLSLAFASAAVRLWTSQHSLGLAVLATLVIDGVTEPVIRIPSFGWVAFVAALALASGSTRART